MEGSWHPEKTRRWATKNWRTITHHIVEPKDTEGTPRIRNSLPLFFLRFEWSPTAFQSWLPVWIRRAYTNYRGRARARWAALWLKCRRRRPLMPRSKALCRSLSFNPPGRIQCSSISSFKRAILVRTSNLTPHTYPPLYGSHITHCFAQTPSNKVVSFNTFWSKTCFIIEIMLIATCCAG